MAGEIARSGLRLARLDDLQPGATRGFMLGEGDWPLRGLMVRNGDCVDAFVNRCPHAGHQLNFLSDNFLTPDGTLILCRSHGALFEKASGRCVYGPCVGEGLLRVPVAVADGWVCLASDIDIDRVATRHW